MISFKTDTSKISLFALFLMFLALIISSVVGLQLFQDGSSYLFELLQSNSAIRHHRISVFVIQLPVILFGKLVDKDSNLQILRLIFCFSYSLIPLISISLSWLVIRNKREDLLVWAALIILFINLVNFSWVSELLIALQLSCPLFLASILIPGSQLFWFLMLVVFPIILFLHPLVILLFATLAIGTAYVGYKKTELRRSVWLCTVIFIAAIFIKSMLSFYVMTPYETSFLELQETKSYLFSTSLENKFLLISSLVIGLSLIFRKLSTRSRSTTAILFLLISIQSLEIIFTLINLNLTAPTKILLCLGFWAVLIIYHYHWHNSSSRQTILFYSCLSLIIVTSLLLLSQYLVGRGFHLKTGLSLFTSMFIMLMAVIDRVREPSLSESVQRFKLTTLLSIIFSLVIISKSLIWQSSVQKMKQSLTRTDSASCVEFMSEDFTWLEDGMYKIINNWSLPSLALVTQDDTPRKLLLSNTDCKLYQESGVVQIDPWTALPKNIIVPKLN